MPRFCRHWRATVAILPAPLSGQPRHGHSSIVSPPFDRHQSRPASRSSWKPENSRDLRRLALQQLMLPLMEPARAMSPAAATKVPASAAPSPPQCPPSIWNSLHASYLAEAISQSPAPAKLKDICLLFVRSRHRMRIRPMARIRNFAQNGKIRHGGRLPLIWLRLPSLENQPRPCCTCLLLTKLIRETTGSNQPRQFAETRRFLRTGLHRRDVLVSFLKYSIHPDELAVRAPSGARLGRRRRLNRRAANQT